MKWKKQADEQRQWERVLVCESRSLVFRSTACRWHPWLSVDTKTNRVDTNRKMNSFGGTTKWSNRPNGAVCNSQCELIAKMRNIKFLFIWERKEMSPYMGSNNFRKLPKQLCGPGSSVATATDYGLDGPGSNSGGDEIFRPSRPTLWAHPAYCKMGTGSFPGVNCDQGVLLTTHPLLVPRSWKSRAILLPTLWATPGL